MIASSNKMQDHGDTGSTARIDRRNTVLAQIEAALLADKLSILELGDDRCHLGGSDPYNSGRPGRDAWGSRRR
jgi:hypothetical protein